MANRYVGGYITGETRTAKGQLVRFTCRPDDRATVADFLATSVQEIEIPTTRRVDAPERYVSYTRYDIQRHKYAGWDHEDSRGGCIEVLEVRDAPNERNGFIVYDSRSPEGGVFTEWASIPAALEGLKNFWKHELRSSQTVWQDLGCQRFVPCGALTPWFYAVGNQELIGDYAFPEGLQDDPAYVFGRKFVVCLSEGDAPRVKTCLGTRFLSGDYGDSPHYRKPWHERVVYWNDGSTSTFDSQHGPSDGAWARPLADGEMWVTEALAQFQVLLSGKTDQFSINFTDGTQFVGRFIPAKASVVLTKAGEYYARLKIEGEDDQKGKFDFSPTEEFPNVVAFLLSKMATKFPGKKITILEIRPNTLKGKKWAGVFFDRSKSE